MERKKGRERKLWVVIIMCSKQTPAICMHRARKPLFRFSLQFYPPRNREGGVTLIQRSAPAWHVGPSLCNSLCLVLVPVYAACVLCSCCIGRHGAVSEHFAQLDGACQNGQTAGFLMGLGGCRFIIIMSV